MTETETTTAPASGQAGAAYWIVAVVSLLWNSFGGYDYTMTKLRNMEYLAGMAGGADKATEMLAAIEAMPVWAHVLWALGVWGAVLGSILLLVRSRHAVTAFLVSMVTAVLSFAYQFTTPMGAEMASGAGLIMTVVILGAVVFFWWWARKQAAGGILR
jgi:hypothetical protein